ncbi:hypothetical protein [Cytobacillus gottheilii]|uniref:hypothetical protein n=1 Tax=Cytobacillus gottheilii TaxID=859144 RepID=UPI002493E7D9|nr:hypothetical protein [Cytobacillus gottheilii]
MPEKNYHSRLLDISEKFDQVIQKLKSSYIDKKYQQHWILWLLLCPWRDFKKVKDIQEGVNKLLNSSFFLSLLPILSSIAAAVGGHFLLEEIPTTVQSIIGGIIGYVITILIYFPTILKYNSDHFHLGAYRVWRRQEYNLFQGAFLDAPEDFYFKGIYDYVTRSGEISQLVDKRLGDFLQNERANYKSEIRSLKDQLEQSNDNAKHMNTEFKSVIADHQQFLDQLMVENKETLLELGYLIQLLKDINMLLFRKFNGKFTRKDLNILTGFTLYELQGNKLVLIEDVQTSGASPKVIPLDDPKYKDYGAVRVIKDKDNHTPYINEPYPEHMIVSYSYNIDHKAIWVYNFHFDMTDERILKLLVGNGTIDSREIYRLVHALCLLTLEEDYFFEKEAGSK